MPCARPRAFLLIFRYERSREISGSDNAWPTTSNRQLTIWGRANSVNVQKVLWCLRELDLAYERIDAGMAFGKNNEPDYLAMNPNGRVPTLVDGDFVLWESNSIMRYLCLAYGKGSPIYPAAPKQRAGVDRWLDWTLSTLQPVDRPVFWALVRTPPEKRDMVAIQKDADAEAVQWRIVEAQLATRRFIEGDEFTIADIALGAYARRWFGVEGITKPKLPNLERWFARVRRPAGFRAIHRAADVVISSPLSARAAGDAGADADGAADLHAGVGAFDLHKARAIRSAWIGRRCALQREHLAGRGGLVGFLKTRAARPARQLTAARQRAQGEIFASRLLSPLACPCQTSGRT